MSNLFYDSTGNNITFTTPTDTTSTLNLTNTTWFPYYQESTWMPYHEIKYKPEFHIKLGYKIQLNTMWDDWFLIIPLTYYLNNFCVRESK